MTWPAHPLTAAERQLISRWPLNAAGKPMTRAQVKRSLKEQKAHFDAYCEEASRLVTEKVFGKL